jgi:t-SNARE complex subunit (syntaxin)
MANYEQSSAYSNGRRPLGGAGEQGYGYSHEQYNVSIDDENINSANHEYGTRYASSTLTIADFLTRVESIKKEIESLSSNISAIASLHQRTISSTDSASTSAALESVISQTQILITRIRDQIKYLETDVAQSGGNTIKQSQIRSLRRQFKNRIEQYQQEEQIYKKRYQEQIARHYRVIHPEADEAEIQEAITADWGNEGVFQTAVRTSALFLTHFSNFLCSSNQTVQALQLPFLGQFAHGTMIFKI